MWGNMTGVTREMADSWAPACDEYFDNFEQGFYDESNILQLILPADKTSVEAERGDFVIGHAGVDGIYFCFREGKTGVFAYYGIDDEHVLVAPNIRELVQGWTEGSLVL